MDWMNIVLGVYDCENNNGPVDKYIYMVKATWLGEKDSAIDYLTFQGFLDIKTGLPADIEWGDVDYVALCERTHRKLYDPSLPWDEQTRHNICTGMVNLFKPHADGYSSGCSISGLTKPTVGRPGELAPWDYYDPWTRSQKTGVCELATSTIGAANSECRNSSIAPECSPNVVLISEVNGDPKNKGSDWIEVWNTATAGPTCEFRGCKFFFSHCDSSNCTDVAPPTLARTNFDLPPNKYALFFHDQVRHSYMTRTRHSPIRATPITALLEHPRCLR